MNHEPFRGLEVKAQPEGCGYQQKLRGYREVDLMVDIC